MSRTAEREDFIARLTRELPDQPSHVVAELGRKLLRAAATLQRLAELGCSSEAADRDRVACPADTTRGGPCLCDYSADGHGDVPRWQIQDWNIETRITVEAGKYGLGILTQGDPRGYVLRVVPPSYAARNQGRDRYHLEWIGVPA